jgi:hypothetical protein
LVSSHSSGLLHATCRSSCPRPHRLAASPNQPRSSAGRSAWLGQAGAPPSCRPRLRLAGCAGLRQPPRWSSGWPGSAPAAAQPRRQVCPPLVTIGHARTVGSAVAAPAAAWPCGCRRTATPPGLPAASRHRPRGHRQAGCGRAGRRLVARAAGPQDATARGGRAVGAEGNSDWEGRSLQPERGSDARRERGRRKPAV